MSRSGQEMTLYQDISNRKLRASTTRDCKVSTDAASSKTQTLSHILCIECSDVLSIPCKDKGVR